MAFVNQTSLFDTSLPNSRIVGVTCESAASVGHWVIATSAGAVIRAQANIVDNSNVLGLIEEKASITSCTVRVAGVSKAVFMGLDVTSSYFLSASIPGEMTLIPPTGTGNVVLNLGQPFSATTFFVNKGTRLVRS